MSNIIIASIIVILILSMIGIGIPVLIYELIKKSYAGGACVVKDGKKCVCSIFTSMKDCKKEGGTFFKGDYCGKYCTSS